MKELQTRPNTKESISKIDLKSMIYELRKEFEALKNSKLQISNEVIF